MLASPEVRVSAWGETAGAGGGTWKIKVRYYGEWGKIEGKHKERGNVFGQK